MRSRPTAAVIQALVFIATVVTVAIVPLLPRIAERFAIGPVQTGALLAAPNFAMVVVSIPAGLVADRVGPRAATQMSAILLSVATIAEALVHSFAPLLAVRLLIGVASGVAWTTGLAWLADAEGDDGQHGPLAATATSGGAGLVAGPAVGALIGRPLGVGAPFLILGIVAAIIAAALLLVERGEYVGIATAKTKTRLVALRSAWREAALVSAASALVLSALTSGTINLLAPLELHAAGVSAQTIGLALSAAAGLYIIASAIVVRFSRRLIALSTLAIVLLAMATALIPATLSVSAVAVAGTVMMHAPLRGTVATISYPLGAAHAGHVDLGSGAAMGLLNGVWATAGVIGPLLAGALAQIASPRLAFALLAGGSVLTGIILMRGTPRMTSPAVRS